MSKPDIHPTETVSLDSLRPWPRNYNQHTEGQTIVLGSSLHTLGQFKNIVIWRDYIVAGHGLVEAAKARGYTEIEAKRLPDGWPESKVEAILVSDNELAKLSTPDDAMLAGLLQDLRLENADWFGATGWDGDRLDGLLRELGNAGEPGPGTDAEPQIDRAAELLQKWEVQPGDMWRIGEHRLVCGDCTDAATVARVMGGEKAQIVFTDPPYGVSVGAKNRMLNSFQKAGRNLTDIESDDLKPEELKAMLLPAFVNVRKMVMADDCTVFMTAPQGGELSMMMMMMMKEAGLPIRHVLIWKKNAPTFSMGRLDYDYQHEPILLTWGKRHKRPLQGKHRTSIWEIDKPRASAEHPTMKPPELYENAYLNNSDKGDVAFEPYAGSGTAFVASQNTGRIARGVEISPAYCAVILERMHTAFPDLPIVRLDNPMSGTLTHE